MGIKLKNSVLEWGRKALAVLGQGQAWVSGDPAQQLFCIWVGVGPEDEQLEQWSLGTL